MPCTAHELRYQAERTYPILYAYLSRQAQRYLGMLKYDAFERDLVVGHVIEQLVRLGLLGGEDNTALTALDRLSNAQFYAFLNHSIRNKAIDRLRKHRLHISSVAELEASAGAENEEDLLNEAVNSLWGAPPFATPEDATLALVSQQELRNLLIHCIKELSSAPHQLHAMLQELEEIGATELLHSLIAELTISPPAAEMTFTHVSQHRDHAHKKLRFCVQQKSTNLIVMVAVRLTEYGALSTDSDKFLVDIQTLAQDDLSEDDVRTGLNELVAEGLLDWQNRDAVHFTSAQLKRLRRYYKQE